MSIPFEGFCPDDIIVMIMGPTGGGKSNFIDVLAQQFGSRTGHGLESRTSDVQVITLDRYNDGNPITLVEIPGFGGTKKSDLETLNKVGCWLQEIYRRDIKLTGVLYMHRITDNRMGGSQLESFRMLGEFCGDKAMGRVVLVTTMWDRLTEPGTGEKREQELKTKFWHNMLRNGAQTARFINTLGSAKEIVDGLLARRTKRETLLLQEELVDLKMRPNETHAARALFSMLQQALGRQKKSVEQLMARMNEHPHLIEMLQEEQEVTRQILDDVRELKIPLSRKFILFFRRKGEIEGIFDEQRSRKATRNSISACQRRLRVLVSNIMMNGKQRDSICALTGDEAQHVADYFNMVLHEPGILTCSEGTYVLSSLCELAKSARVYPRCYVLKRIKHDTSHIEGGGYADVYKGRRNGQEICLKVVRIFNNEDNAQVLRVHVKELVLWAHLSHPNILPFYGVYLSDDSPQQRICLVSPWMENGNLRSYLRGRPKIPRIPLLLDVINGLVYLHQSSVVHGDLKALNILVSDHGRALIADFGLSHVATGSKSPSTKTPNGTIRWEAPELLNGGSEYGFARPTRESDIWSFSCLCYEVLTGEFPFYQYSDHRVAGILCEGKEVPTRLPGADGNVIDDRVWEIMMRCWSYLPQSRPTCDIIRETIVGLQVQDDRPELPTQVWDTAAFWEATKAESRVEVDYQRVEEILSRIQRACV